MLTFILLFGLVLLHELGHFVAAKWFKVKVEEFGIGLPPRAKVLVKWRGTEYTLNYLPLGGFVRLLGEEGDPAWWEKLNPRLRKQALFAKPAWQRAVILMAGVGVNFVVGIVCFSLVYYRLGIPRSTGEQVLVQEVAAGSPAERAGIKAGEVVVRMGEEEVVSAAQFVEWIGKRRGEMVNLYLAELTPEGTRATSSRQVAIILREEVPPGEGTLGVGVVDYPILVYDKPSWYMAPLLAVVEGTKEAYGWTRYMMALLVRPKLLWEGLAGPVKVLQIGQEQAAGGEIAFLRFAGVISFNLAVFNLLPLPALDGGRLLFLGVEKVLGRKRTGKIESYVHGVGIVLLIGLLLIVTARDLWGK